MKREELLRTLKLAAPALLSDNEAILPILKSLKFTGSHVISSNDVIAVCLAVPVTKSAIVPGRNLISFLSACNSKSVEFLRTKKGNLLVKCASSKLLLSSHPDDEWPFEFPDIEKAETLETKDTFFDALELCSSQSPDTGLGSWHGGVILMLGTTFGVYGVGQSRATISFSRAEGMISGRKTDRRVVVPSQFCKTVVSVAKVLDSPAKLHVTDDSAVVEWGDGENIVATRLLDVDMPDVVGRFRTLVLDTTNFIPINSNLVAALRRASMIGAKGTCRISTEENGLRVWAKSGVGTILNDLVSFGKGEDIPDVDELIAADLICKRLEDCTEIAFGSQATILRSESGAFIYLVANRLNEKKEA